MAFGEGTITSIAGAAGDLFSASALRTKATGSRIEGQEYGLSASLARQNKQFAETSTAIKSYQVDRELYKSLGETTADVASSGFSMSGSALDILRDSASQGALTRATVQAQGQIEEAGFEEQAKSYDLMQQASLLAAHADEKAAFGADITAGLKAVSAIASLVI